MRLNLSEVDALAAGLLTAGARTKRDVAKIVKTEAEKAGRVMRENAAVRTGELRNSITVSPVRTVRGVAIASAAAHAPHAHLVNFGTARQPPQPFVPPAAEAVSRSFPAALEQVAVDGVG